MRRRKAIKLLGLLPLIGNSSAIGEERAGQPGLESNAQYFRLTWWPLRDSGNPLVVTAHWAPWVSNDGESQLTQSSLKVLKALGPDSLELFKCLETGRLVFAMPLEITTLLATVWLAGSAYLIKVIRFEADSISVVLEERSVTF